MSPVQIQSPLPTGNLPLRQVSLYGPLVKWLRHRPFTAVTRVRVSYGSPARRKRHIACDEFFLFHCKTHRALILLLLASKPEPLPHPKGTSSALRASGAGLRFGSAALRRFCFPWKMSILTVPSKKKDMTAGHVFLFGFRRRSGGIFASGVPLGRASTWMLVRPLFSTRERRKGWYMKGHFRFFASSFQRRCFVARR